jgi:uncharacterized protein (DUF2345 family)
MSTIKSSSDHLTLNAEGSGREIKFQENGVQVGTSATMAFKDADQTFTGSQRGTVVTDNDGTFDMNGANNFSCTPAGAITLTFTNITAGQSGFILMINSGAQTISAASTTKVDATILATISAAGTYLVGYMSIGGNVYLTNSAVYT